MIFLTVGSELVFNRIVKAVDLWAAQNKTVQIIAQTGKSNDDDYLPQNMEIKSVVSPAEYNRYCTEADFLIAHAGMGSIITALTTGKPIVIMPRRGKFKETRNDHQVATAKRFASREGIFVALNEDEIPKAIEEAQDFAASDKMQVAGAFAPQEFTDKLAQYIASC